MLTLFEDHVVQKLKSGKPQIIIKEKLKITYLYQYFGTPAGSWSTRVYEFTRRWVELGHEVTVITCPYDKSDIKSDGFVSYQNIEGVKIIVINSGDSNKFSFLKRAIRAVNFSIVSTYYTLIIKSDIVIASSGPITIGIPALISKLLKRTKFIFEVRDLWPLGAIEMGILRNKVLIKFSLWFEKIIYKYSDGIVACSSGMKKHILQFDEAKRIEVIPNIAVMNNELEHIKYNWPNWYKAELKILIYAGSIGKMDDVELLIDSFCSYEFSKEIKLVLIGDGVERQILEKKVIDYRLQDQVIFLGLQPKEIVHEWYKIAYISFVLFKPFKVLSTSSPNKLFDTLLFGVPFIHNTGGWILDLTEENKVGVALSANSPNAMIKAINYYLGDPETRQRHALNAFNCSKSLFDINKVTKIYVDFLEKIIG